MSKIALRITVVFKFNNRCVLWVFLSPLEDVLILTFPKHCSLVGDQILHWSWLCAIAFLCALLIFQDIAAALERFKRYHHIWQREKEETIENFVKGNPLLSEFESQVLYYRDLEQEINSEPEYICVGTVALYTGRVYILFHILWSGNSLQVLSV